jgi:hypothetical protein
MCPTLAVLNQKLSSGAAKNPSRFARPQLQRDQKADFGRTHEEKEAPWVWTINQLAAACQ